MNQFSSRTSWDGSESSYAAAVREARASGGRLYDLTLSNPTRCGFSFDADALLGPLSDLRALVYDPDPRGILTAREAVAAYYADHGALSPDDLVLTTSTSESYSFLFRLLCDPGDEVLVAQPSYPLFDFLADLDDVRLRPYPLFYDHGWWIDLAELERAITPRTRAVLVVHPNNPTGHWTRTAEREALEALCKRHSLALIVDEVFLDYPLESNFGARSFTSGEHPALTFVLSGMSKIAALPQMKAAWIATLGPDAEKAEALGRLEIIADTFLSMNAPVQLAMPSWLAGRKAIQSQILERARANLTMLRRIAQNCPEDLRVLPPEAGWSAVLDLPSCVGEPDCAERLVRERGVVMHPGNFYGMPEASRLVVSLIGPTADFEAGIQRATSPICT
ncbi:MAG: pyridoxal phosphate-dependent aminotransferase [Acidobacteriota bacterium]|nr:pyridoxal phosphate-dependent aminotransferase [Acidobacteriota bacterium]